MPRLEFIDLIKEIKKTGKAKIMSKRDFIWLFGNYEKRTSGNVWRINEYLNEEKIIVEPNYQHGWIDDLIEIKEKDKIKIKKDGKDEDIFDPISRLSVLKAASNTPLSINRDCTLEKAYHVMWKNDFSQLPIMNDERNILGLISWQSIAKGLIARKGSDKVKDYSTNDYKILDENTPLFDAIREVINYGVVFVKNGEGKIKGPVTTSDLNEEFIEQIEPYILLEQIENYIRIILHNKIIIEDVVKLITINDIERKVESISDMTFGEYIRIIENGEMWNTLKLPFNRVDFVEELHEIRNIRNGVMHFHPDKLAKGELPVLRRMSKFLKDYVDNCD